MYSGLQNVFFENLLIVEFFNCHNDIHSNLHTQISSVVVFNDHDGTFGLFYFSNSTYKTNEHYTECTCIRVLILTSGRTRQFIKLFSITFLRKSIKN
ncbi:unnamed protein product [Tenebrio molitor]|nr:unnamed protein product [Tenebrio molitor]